MFSPRLTSTVAKPGNTFPLVALLCFTLVLTSMVAPAVSVHAQEMNEEPQPGDVYTLDNLKEIYPYTGNYFDEWVKAWEGSHEGIRIEVEETEHPDLPESYVQATRDFSDEVELVETDRAGQGYGPVKGYVAGLPFPTENSIGEGYDVLEQALQRDTAKSLNSKAAWMIFWNTLYHPRSDAIRGLFSTQLVNRYDNRQYREFQVNIAIANHRTMEYGPGKGRNYVNPAPNVNSRFHYLVVVRAPASIYGVSNLIIPTDAIVDFAGETSIYAYLPSMRRVIPMSSAGAGHCAPQVGTDVYNDDGWAFSGNPSWMNIEYLGTKDLLVVFDPETETMLNDNRQLFDRNFTKSGFYKRSKFQLREHYVLEMTPTEEHSDYCYSKRTMYIDKDTWWVTVMTMADKQGRPWKTHRGAPGAIPWTAQDTLEDGEVYYDTDGTMLWWDMQAKHFTHGTTVEQHRPVDNLSYTDLTATGMLKVIK